MSSSCSANSSNLLGNVNVSDISGSGSRLLMTVPLTGFSGGRLSNYIGDDGVTAGDAIRYNAIPYDAVTNPSGGKYVKAKADIPENSEVVGIIESISQGDSATAVIVLSGQIDYPTTNLVEAIHIDVDAGVTGSAGGNDVYFLSAATAGAIQNLAPSEPTQVIKPIYQVAPDSPFSGQVVNYIGYQSGGQIVVEDTNVIPLGSLVMVPFASPREEATGTSIKRGWYPINGTKFNLDDVDGSTYTAAYNTVGSICSTVLEIGIREIPSSNILKKRMVIKIGTKKYVGYVEDFNSALRTIKVNFASSYFGKFESFLTSGSIINMSNGLLFTVNSFKYKHYTYPTISKNEIKKSIKFSDGDKEFEQPIIWYAYNPVDTGPRSGIPRTHAMSISNVIEVEELKVTKLVAENSTVKIIDVADALKAMNQKIDDIVLKVDGHGASTGNSNIEEK